MAVSRKEWIWGSAWLQAHLPSIKMLFFKTNKQKNNKAIIGEDYSADTDTITDLLPRDAVADISEHSFV